MKSKQLPTVFQLSDKFTSVCSKNIQDVSRDYTLDGLYKIAYIDENKTLTNPIFEYNIKTSEVSIPEYTDDLHTISNIEYKSSILSKNEKTTYDRAILTMASLQKQTNFLNIYNNNIFTRNLDEGRYMITGSNVRFLVDYLNYITPSRLPYIYCDIETMKFNYNDILLYRQKFNLTTENSCDIYKYIYDISKTNMFDFYTTQTTSFKEFSNTMLSDHKNRCDTLFVCCDMNIETSYKIDVEKNTVYDEFGIPYEIEYSVEKNIEFDENYIIKKNFELPKSDVVYTSMVNTVKVGGSCVVIAHRSELQELIKIAVDVIKRFTTVYVIRPMLLQDHLVMVCRNRYDNFVNEQGKSIVSADNIVSEKYKMTRYNDLVKSIVDLFDKDVGEHIDVRYSEIEKICGLCM